MILDNLNILIINSNFGSRSILRDVLKSFLHKVSINYAQSFKEAKMVVAEEKLDVCFVAFEMGQTEILEFISNLKSDPNLTTPPFIATLRSRGDGSTADITSLYLEGVSGFISEPYTSDDILSLLTTITENKTKLEQKDKLKKASHLLLTEAVRQIDHIAERQSENDESGAKQGVKGLKAISRSLETMYAQDPEQYEKAVIETFESVPVPVKQERAVKKSRLAFKEVKHPGKVIADLMKQRNLSFDDLKHTLKMSAEEFQALLDEKALLDETTSREISRIFGRTSREWLKLQKDYENHLAETKKNQKPDSSS